PVQVRREADQRPLLRRWLRGDRARRVHTGRRYPGPSLPFRCAQETGGSGDFVIVTVMLGASGRDRRWSEGADGTPNRQLGAFTALAVPPPPGVQQLPQR